MLGLYRFESNNKKYRIVYKEEIQQILLFNETDLKMTDINTDDCITIIDGFENVELKNVSKYFLEYSFNELQERFFNNELNENSKKLYFFCKKRYQQILGYKIEVLAINIY